MENLSSCLSLEAARFLAAMFKNSGEKLKDRRWNFEDKVLLCLSLNIATNPISFSTHYSLSHPDDPCNLS
jgi:hypothetical protein